MNSAAMIKNLFLSQPKEQPYGKRLSQAAQALREADGVLIGAGAGLSTAAGLSYDGEAFQKEFRPWIERYGITDLYSSSFYPWPSEEERWAYWARHIYMIRFRPAAMPLYKELLRLVGGKNYFVLTTNVDGQFEKAGFAPDRIFATQGDYAYLQSVSGQPAKLYYDEQWVKEIIANTRDCRIPSSLVPHCPDNGELMTPNLRVDDTFVEDEHWHQQAAAYSDFVHQMMGKRLVLLELGVGFNTPGIIRFPFEQMAQRFAHCTLIRLNKFECNLLLGGVRRFVPFKEPMDEVVRGLMDAAGQNQSVMTSVTTSSK